MAASTVKMPGVSEDSSSSDDEVLKRCQEAVWETRNDKKKDGDKIAPPSKRVVVADHEHDGNELQVTKGFQTHVAKKLGHYLDNCITETKTSSCVESAKYDDDDDDGGFRLFSSSIPGQAACDPVAPVRRRPALSSSDSDSEMEARLKEAAVSVKDLLPSLSHPSLLSAPSIEPPSAEKVKKKKKKKAADVEKESDTVKKVKKKKQKQEESDCTDSTLNSQSKSDNGITEQEDTGGKVKRKKDKKKEINTED